MAIDVSINRHFTIHGRGPKYRVRQIPPKCFLTSNHPLKIFRNLTAALAVVAGLCTAHAAFCQFGNEHLGRLIGMVGDCACRSGNPLFVLQLPLCASTL